MQPKFVVRQLVLIVTMLTVAVSHAAMADQRPNIL